MPLLVPTLRVEDGLEAALSAEVLSTIPGDVLREFVGQRRWFGAKGSALTHVKLTLLAPLESETLRAAICSVDVTLDGSRVERYQLPLVVRPAPQSGEAEPDSVLARVEAGSERGLLFDATGDPAFLRALGVMLAHGARVENGGVLWRTDPVGDGSAESGVAQAAPRVMGVEQSNTSVLYGEVAILKLFRRLQPGINPDVEITRELTRLGFENTPALLGTITLGENGAESTAGMLQRLVPGATDAWKYALDSAYAYLNAPLDRDPQNPFAIDAERLGRITRGMHRALASSSEPDFAPRPATADDVHEWSSAIEQSIGSALDLLNRQLSAKSLDRIATGPGEATLQRRQGAFERVQELVGEVTEDAGSLIRHHGDYHLGQVLRSADGEFYIIDFEGEPARSIEERRRRHSALRDVAGMLRSFAYAAASAATNTGGVGSSAVVESRAARWERDVRSAFLAGYQHPPDGEAARFLPQDSVRTLALITLFEIEKIFYELTYELNNRPAWAWIPLRGIARLF